MTNRRWFNGRDLQDWKMDCEHNKFDGPLFAWMPDWKKACGLERQVGPFSWITISDWWQTKPHNVWSRSLREKLKRY